MEIMILSKTILPLSVDEEHINEAAKQNYKQMIKNINK